MACNFLHTQPGVELTCVSGTAAPVTDRTLSGVQQVHLIAWSVSQGLYIFRFAFYWWLLHLTQYTASMGKMYLYFGTPFPVLNNGWQGTFGVH